MIIPATDCYQNHLVGKEIVFDSIFDRTLPVIAAVRVCGLCINLLKPIIVFTACFNVLQDLKSCNKHCANMYLYHKQLLQF